MSNRSEKAQVWIGLKPKGKVPARVLLFRVIEKRGGGWHPVTGGVDPGETHFEGAMRELEEETGFNPRKGEWVDLQYSFRYEGRFGPATEHAFGFIVSETLETALHPKLDPKEHLTSEWVSIEEASLRLGFPNQKEALLKFSKFLTP